MWFNDPELYELELGWFAATLAEEPHYWGA